MVDEKKVETTTSQAAAAPTAKQQPAPKAPVSADPIVAAQTQVKVRRAWLSPRNGEMAVWREGDETRQVYYVDAPEEGQPELKARFTVSESQIRAKSKKGK